MSEEWTIRTLADEEVRFQRLGERYLARLDHGRMSASTEYFLRGGPAISRKGWQVTIPDNWRGKPGKEPSGLRWLRVTEPSGRFTVWEFYKGLGPHDLARAYEARASEETPHEGQQHQGSVAVQRKGRNRKRQAQKSL